MNKLSGVFAATVTPFDPATGAVLHNWIGEHLAYLRERGCDGVVPLGTNGEGPSLSVRERQAVVETVMAAAGDLWVAPGVGCASLTDTVELTRLAFSAGADAVLVIPPFYYKQVSSAGVLAYYRRLCDLALQPGQQILLYHFPQVSAVPIDDQIMRGLLDTHPSCVVGIKDSSGDAGSIRRWLHDHPALRVFAGSDALASWAFGAGCAGTISAAANVAPHLIQAVRTAVQAGAETEALQGRLDALRALLGRFPIHAATKFLVGRYAGLAPVAVRPPLLELGAAQRAELSLLASQLDIS